MKSLIKALVFLLLLSICGCESTDENNKDAVQEKFEFIRKEPGNKLGIYTKVIAQSYRKANKRIDKLSINRKYMQEDILESLLERCGTSQKDRPFKWKNCKSDDEGFFALVTGGVPEPKTKTVTYLEVEFKPFETTDENGEEKICVLEDVYKSKVYIVLKTYSHYPSNDSFPLGVVESVAAVHQHQLDSHGKHFLSIFGDKIDMESIYNFGEDEYYDRDPPYECFLNIGSSESTTVLQEKCDFYCLSASQVTPEMMEEILKQAKEAADKEEKIESSRDEL